MFSGQDVHRNRNQRPFPTGSPRFCVERVLLIDMHEEGDSGQFEKLAF